MNDPVVFCGPTIQPEAAKALFPAADCRGPVARGDVLRASEEQPAVICIIDGYFEHRPAVTHKEILWAMKRGIPVFGASSMGALRAAELSAYGMVGVGVVFDNFMTGRLEDEDEVAVPHTEGPSFRSGADALVNIRSTLDRAAAQGVVGEETLHALLRVAKSIFYAERNYPALLRAAEDHGLERSCLRSLRDWLAIPDNRVDQKRLDAEELLTGVRERFARRDFGPTPNSWSFPTTASWQKLLLERADERLLEAPPRRAEDTDLLLHAMLEEVQLLGSRTYEYVLAKAAFRKLCGMEAASTKGLARGSSPAGLSEAEIDSAMPRVLAGLHRMLAEVLRSMGDEERVRERAELKQKLLAGATLPVPNQDTLRAFWLRIGEPESVDLEETAAALGFANKEALLLAIAREEAFQQRLTQPA
jgi:hypothetical protein